jgi:NAD(P)-dependent dehydrogenase (short-subunit alcohol dehydrogenase family)
MSTESFRGCSEVDVTNRAGLEPALNMVESELGGIYILVNNAGNVSLSGGVLQETPEDWDSVIETQLNAVFLLSKLAARSMVSRRGGKIIAACTRSLVPGSPFLQRSERSDRSTDQVHGH